MVNSAYLYFLCFDIPALYCLCHLLGSLGWFGASADTIGNDRSRETKRPVFRYRPFQLYWLANKALLTRELLLKKPLDSYIVIMISIQLSLK